MDSVLGLLGSRRQQNPHGPRHRVVVIGGGFAGLAVAHNLGEECDVVVVEIKRWLEFTPSVHTALAGDQRDPRVLFAETAPLVPHATVIIAAEPPVLLVVP